MCVTLEIQEWAALIGVDLLTGTMGDRVSQQITRLDVCLVVCPCAIVISVAQFQCNCGGSTTGDYLCWATEVAHLDLIVALCSSGAIQLHLVKNVAVRFNNSRISAASLLFFVALQVLDVMSFFSIFTL